MVAVVEVRQGGDGLVLSVRGPLDHGVGSLLVEAVQAALEVAQGQAVEVDLRAVERWSQDGLQALAACARLGGPGRPVRFRAGTPAQGPG